MKKQMLISIPLALVLALSGFIGCSKSGGGSYGMSPPNPVTPPANTVVISNFAFGPGQLNVPANTTVTFTNNDGVAHTATSDAGLWDTGSIASGASKTIKFTTAGAYPYHCTFHPMMKATVVVQ